MSVFGWFEDIPVDLAMVHKELQESRRREEVLRKELNALAKRVSQLERLSKLPAVAPSEEIISEWESLKETLFKRIFRK